MRTSEVDATRERIKSAGIDATLERIQSAKNVIFILPGDTGRCKVPQDTVLTAIALKQSIILLIIADDLVSLSCVPLINIKKSIELINAEIDHMSKQPKEEKNNIHILHGRDLQKTTIKKLKKIGVKYSGDATFNCEASEAAMICCQNERYTIDSSMDAVHHALAKRYSKSGMQNLRREGRLSFVPALNLTFSLDNIEQQPPLAVIHDQKRVVRREKTPNTRTSTENKN